MTNKITTIKDIANELDISATAVSRALNDKGGISKELVAKVVAKAKELNYKPNSIARSLKSNKTKTIGVVISDSSYTFFPMVIKGIQDMASSKGYSIILCNTDSVRGKEIDALNLLVNKRIDGVIFAASMLTNIEDYSFLHEYNIPFIYLIRRNESPEADYVINDNIFGTQLIMNYLLKFNQKIHFFNIGQYNPSAKERLAGYKKALEDHKLPYDPALIYNMNPTIEDGYATMRQLLESNIECKSIFCGCDIISIGVMEAIHEFGLKVPDDIKVAGYDDIDFAAYLRVPLTTVRQPKYSIGSKGTEILIQKIEHQVKNVQHIILKPELIIRQSS